MDINQMEEAGIADHFITLKRYIMEFVDRKYPLSQEDIKSIINDSPSENVLKRQKTVEIMKKVMDEELEKIANKNKMFIDDINKGNLKREGISIEEQNKEINDIIQKMLEELWKEENKEKDVDDEYTL